MRPSENEIRDAIKLIQARKPLPDKYRFLLFDDDREVELVWNGKTNDVTSTVLPFQTIEHIDEPRDEEKIKNQKELFDFSGKQVGDWTNKLIWGDTERQKKIHYKMLYVKQEEYEKYPPRNFTDLVELFGIHKLVRRSPNEKITYIEDK